jgi:hypothetical protein
MNQLPPESIEDLIQEALDPKALRRRYRMSHPLSNFAASTGFEDNLFADIILDLISDTVWEEPESMRYKGATWCLLESERTFFFACHEAGIDAKKLRCHLQLCRQLGVEEMDKLLEEREDASPELL